jgi:hypothetical protein
MSPSLQLKVADPCARRLVLMMESYLIQLRFIQTSGVLLHRDSCGT